MMMFLKKYDHDLQMNHIVISCSLGVIIYLVQKVVNALLFELENEIIIKVKI